MSLKSFLQSLPLPSGEAASELGSSGQMRATQRLQKLETVQRCFSASAGPSLTGHVNWEMEEDQVLLVSQQIPWAVDPGIGVASKAPGVPDVMELTSSWGRKKQIKFKINY